MAAENDQSQPPAQAAKPIAPAAGDSASSEALRQIRRELAAAKSTQAALPHLKTALKALGVHQYERGRDAAQMALKSDPDSFLGNHLLAIAHEKLGDWTASLEAYEKTLALKPDSPEVANDLGRLAFRMGMLPQAEALFRFHQSQRANAPESANNLACVLRDQMRYAEAIDLLQPVIQAHPDRAMLWNTLGTVMADMGETDQADIFFAEALRLDPAHVKARYNRSNTQFALGDKVGAIDNCRRAMAVAETPEDKAAMGLALSAMLLASGDLPQGWDAYGARLSPHYVEPVHFLVNRPQWRPGDDIDGRHLLLIGEQGLGDEVLFANVIDDVLEALGPGGRLSLTVDRRLTPLFQRSFPRVQVGTHHTIQRHGRHIRSVPWITDWADVDLWAPMAEPLIQFRPQIASFPNRPQGFLKPDPDRIAYWREKLDALPGGKVGLVWTSMVMNTSRKKYFSPFDRWGPILQTPGTTFVNLQYGDCTADIEMVRRKFGVNIVQPGGIDLKMDLDDVAALSSAMDLVIGPANATSNIAAACGTPAWLIATPGAWTQLGTDHYPWYTQARVFTADTFGDWDPVIAAIGDALGDFVGGQPRKTAAG